MAATVTTATGSVVLAEMVTDVELVRGNARVISGLAPWTLTIKLHMSDGSTVEIPFDVTTAKEVELARLALGGGCKELRLPRRAANKPKMPQY